jgi:hypothetical protein
MGIQTGLLGGEEGGVQSGSCAAGDIEESTHSVVRPDPKAPGWFKRYVREIVVGSVQGVC